jgi:hypothetical protein
VLYKELGNTCKRNLIRLDRKNNPEWSGIKPIVKKKRTQKHASTFLEVVHTHSFTACLRNSTSFGAVWRRQVRGFAAREV